MKKSAQILVADARAMGLCVEIHEQFTRVVRGSEFVDFWDIGTISTGADQYLISVEVARKVLSL